MPLSLIVGPPNSGRVGAVVARVRAELEREPVLVVPTADDVARFERELCREGGATLGVSIRTFAWLVDDLATTLGIEVAPRLSDAQRMALVRAAVAATPLELLSRSATRPGFAPALDALIAELAAGLVTPDDLSRRAAELEHGEYEAELAALCRSYIELRERARRSDAGSAAVAMLNALRRDPGAWGVQPVFLYGFDDLTEAQLELVAALARSTQVTVAVTYADREALAARAALLGRLTEELGGAVEEWLEHDPGYSESPLLAALDRGLFEPGAPPAPTDDGLALLESAGELGEAEAIGIEIARLLASGDAVPDDIAVVLRHPSLAGPLYGRVLERLGVPVAVRASVPLAQTAVGRGLITLCRAAAEGGSAENLLAHLRTDPLFPREASDWLERRIMRHEVATAAEAIEGWQAPPRHLERLLAARGPAGRLRALARTARELAESSFRDAAPLAGATVDGSPPFDPVELRAGVAAAELLDELAEVGELPGCEPADLDEAAAALEEASVPIWRGSAEGRVQILDPYRARSRAARYLFCASLQEGEFPWRGAGDPLLGDDRRGRLEIAALRRREQSEEERYLFHACVSRPTQRLYLSWRSADDEGAAEPRSPFVDDVLDLVEPEAVAELTRVRSLERTVLEPAEAPTVRELARGLAVRGDEARAALAGLDVGAETEARVLALLAGIPDPSALPGPLREPAVVAELSERRILSASTLEGWLTCPYRWFVDHELKPQRLEPEADRMWVGGVVHGALERLYREAPGEDALPRRGDVARWKRRFAELLDEVAAERGGSRATQRATELERARLQIEAFLEEEAETETLLRPRPDLLERRFGFDAEGDPGPLELEGEAGLRGVIDRIDVAPDGKRAVIRDYKLSRRVSGKDKFEENGLLQIQLYALVARRLGLEPVAALYQPLAATKAGDRRMRGIAVAGDHLEGLKLVRTDVVADKGELDDVLTSARERAEEAAGAMRRGAIGRNPLGGKCPSYCQYQPICRLERALGVPAEEENGE